ncbi:MAG TPA: glycosyltransferase [Chloroflexota bacterium]|nr:glycosyltransferase [Chloroflexota bacterium]
MLQTVEVTTKVLDDYRPIVGDDKISAIQALAAPLRGARVLHLNATAFGGGVTELLSALVPLMRSAGLEVDWKVMAGAPELWETTKAIHNLLQGANLARTSAASHLTGARKGRQAVAEQRVITALWNPAMAEIWQRYNALTAELLDKSYDYVVVHDPQPAGVLHFLRQLKPELAKAKWIWRCHIDLTRASPDVWCFLKPYLALYDAAIFTMQEYVKQDVPVSNVALIAPAIDPLSSKNTDLPLEVVRDILRRYDVDPDRPLITQVSRFDPWKDPLGVIDVYRRIKRDIPTLQLALVGSMAADDPEGWRYYELTTRHAGNDFDIHILTNFNGVGNVEVNAFQRASNVVLQKSIREGFGLTVSEALWKARPVVATAVGGIPLQVASGHSGFLVHSTRECADRTRELLNNPALTCDFGLTGRERVRENFLITRDLSDYLQLFSDIATQAQASARTSTLSASRSRP